jgi:hypothetical protein
VGNILFSGFLVTDKWLYYTGQCIETRKYTQIRIGKEWSKICDHVGIHKDKCRSNTIRDDK